MRAVLLLLLLQMVLCCAAKWETRPDLPPAGWSSHDLPCPQFALRVASSIEPDDFSSFANSDKTKVAWASILNDRPGAFVETIKRATQSYKPLNSPKDKILAIIKSDGDEYGVGLFNDSPARTVFLIVRSPSPQADLEEFASSHIPKARPLRAIWYFVILVAAVIIINAVYRLRGFRGEKTASETNSA